MNAAAQESPLTKLLFKLIYGFHMPFFFLLSGFLFDAEKYARMRFGPYCKKRFASYVIPYFIYAFCNLLINIPLFFFAFRIICCCFALFQPVDNIPAEICKLLFRKLCIGESFLINKHISVIIDTAVCRIYEEQDRCYKHYVQ